ncbi:protein phosphatase 1 regulatory subunit 12B isoform X5 [Tribolium madens]|uniref:protein phosphatase 1 regulatory subunit 12B isoform X5 n=1 Tax=Tribolium madens TaxID=41895 RepID=UPI001CF75A10|nr:protein phosphatase 1 regulatory subunit 12B isoform X5 [Tribolium madens]
MSLETRTNSALFKRAEQLKRWEDSDTNREPVYPKQTSRKIKFSSGCVFLAACAAGDKDEVLRLLENGADINTANVDGLTALHQACIDDNSEMVEFLVDHGADVNRGDNEGWTPLHATASCGFLYIAKYLIEKGANVAAVNNDGELAVDISECQKMEDLLNEEIKKRGIDCDAARNEEKRIMLQDAKEWLATKSPLVDAPHPKNGATALHVAAAKGYTDVMKILLQCGADIDAQDIDGWTPLHAAAHWGHKDACQILAENLADMEAKNYVGQTPFDLADNDMLKFLEDLKKKQNKEDVLNRRQAKKRAEIQDRTIEIETPSKVKKVEVEIEKEEKQDDNIEMDVSSESESETESSSETESNSTDDEKKNRVNSLDAVSISNKPAESTRLPPSVPPKQLVDSNNEDNAPSWRKQNTRQTKADLPSPVKTTADSVNNENDVTLRRPSSLQADKESSKEDSNENNSTSSTKTSPVMSPVSNNQPLRSGLKLPIGTNQPVTTTSTPTTPTTPGGTRLQMFKNFFKSFVPPVRDEESETQRKAHAKRVRETRRSTQGVTLEEIKSAEQFVKKKNQPNCNNNNNEQSGANGESPNGVSVTATITTAAPTVITRDTEEPSVTHERRPSWRLKIDSSSKFKLEDATKSSEPPSTPSFVRRTVTQNTITNPRPSSAPVETAETTVTLPLRRPKSQDEKEQDKENDVRNAQATLATQAAIQRRRRPKRRSTGVVSFENMDDMDQDKDPSGGGDYEDSSKLNHEESDRSSRSRLGSTSDIRNENGEIDYKKLYEQALVENSELKDKLKKTDQELRDTKQTLEKLKLVTSKNSLSELEKRERRAMERKLSEMEEELKQLQKLKAENERLKADNRSLTRVITKLTNSPKK